MDCPDCGGPMWDNRAKKASGQYKPNRSDYSCKDKDGCGKGVWVQEAAGNGGGAKRNGGGNGAPAASSATKRALAPLYFQCMKVATATVKQHLGDKAQPGDVIAATATLFVQASQSGAPLMQPSPPKPKPEPEPEPQEEYEENPFG